MSALFRFVRYPSRQNTIRSTNVTPQAGVEQTPENETA